MTVYLHIQVRLLRFLNHRLPLLSSIPVRRMDPDCIRDDVRHQISQISGAQCRPHQLDLFRVSLLRARDRCAVVDLSTTAHDGPPQHGPDGCLVPVAPRLRQRVAGNHMGVVRHGRTVYGVDVRFRNPLDCRHDPVDGSSGLSDPDGFVTGRRNRTAVRRSPVRSVDADVVRLHHRRRLRRSRGTVRLHAGFRPPVWQQREASRISDDDDDDEPTTRRSRRRLRHHLNI